ncbi:MAG: hypothetical protein ABIZ49_06295 [Opitutaceae bacterium]
MTHQPAAGAPRLQMLVGGSLVAKEQHPAAHAAGHTGENEEEGR